MALAKTIFNIMKGGLGRRPLSEDSISGFLFYNDNITDLTGFTTTDNVKEVTSIIQAEQYGITETATNFSDLWYQLKEHFRMGGGAIWVGIFPEPVGVYDYEELKTIHAESAGKIRQYGIFVTKTFDKSDIALINTIMQGFWDEKKPAVAIFGSDYSTTDITALEDLRNLSAQAPKVSVVLGQDTENYPATIINRSTPNVGAVLGAKSGSNVATNILYVSQFNYSDGVEMVTPGFLVNDGSTDDQLLPITDVTFNDTFLDGVDDKGYIFWRYLANVNGSYLNNANNCAEATSDFAYIHYKTVMGKAIRQTDSNLSNLLGGTVKVANGTIKRSSLVKYENAINNALSTMVNDSEISTYDYFIDPSQDIAGTGELKIEITITPVFSSDKITVELGYSV